MEKTRLIALDIDGTLLDDQKRLPPENREVLQEASRRGVLIAIASGRMMPRIVSTEDLLGIDCVLIAYNGGKVVGLRREGRPTIFHKPVPPDIAGFFIDYSREHGYLLNFYHDDRLYAEDGPEHRALRELYESRTGAVYEPAADLRRFRGMSPTKLILLAEPETCDRLRDHFRAHFQDRASIMKSEAEYLEVMAPGVDKGTGLEAIARHYGFSTDEILAVGDADNDVGLIRRAGWGVAVANAQAHVKAVAKAVTERTNNEGAVAEAVRKWVLGAGM